MKVATKLFFESIRKMPDLGALGLALILLVLMVGVPPQYAGYFLRVLLLGMIIAIGYAKKESGLQFIDRTANYFNNPKEKIHVEGDNSAGHTDEPASADAGKETSG